MKRIRTISKKSLKGRKVLRISPTSLILPVFQTETMVALQQKQHKETVSKHDCYCKEQQSPLGVKGVKPREFSVKTPSKAAASGAGEHGGNVENPLCPWGPCSFISSFSSLISFISLSLSSSSRSPSRCTVPSLKPSRTFRLHLDSSPSDSRRLCSASSLSSPVWCCATCSREVECPHSPVFLSEEKKHAANCKRAKRCAMMRS